MSKDIHSILPDSENLLALEPEELAGVVIEVLPHLHQVGEVDRAVQRGVSAKRVLGNDRVVVDGKPVPVRQADDVYSRLCRLDVFIALDQGSQRRAS